MKLFQLFVVTTTSQRLANLFGGAEVAWTRPVFGTTRFLD
jgi:hypothetical protein